MAYSSGARQALNEAASWLVLGACAIAVLFYFDELKSVARTTFGLPAPAMMADSSERNSHQRQASRTTRRQRRSRSASPASSSSGEVALRAGRHGQFVTLAGINGHDARVLVDTGASAVALTSADAEAAGIFLSPSDYTVRVSTANGIGRAAPVMLESVTIGDITIHDVRALVNPPGTLHITLLGMTFLNRLSRVDIGNGRMVLEQ